MPNPNYTIAVLNAIRDSASAEYVARVPASTVSNITAVGNALTTYTVAMNEFTTTLIEKIGLTVFSNKLFENKLAKFKKGMLPSGADIEEIFVEMSGCVEFDETGATSLARSKPTILSQYHRQNRKDTYKITVSSDQVKQAFTSLQGVTDLLAKIVTSMYTGANYDEFVIMKELLAGYSANYFDYEVAPITDAVSGAEFVKTTRKAVLDLAFMSDKYNKASVMTYNNVEDLVLFVNKDILSEISVDVLATAFHSDNADFNATIVPVDDFGSMIDTYGLLVDKEFFMIWDTLQTVESIRNPQGLFTNSFLHVWQILSLSQFKNAIRFKKVTV